MINTLGALIVEPQNTSHPIKFFVGADGRLFEHRWDVQANDWRWGDHGAPDGTGVATAPRALILEPQNTSHPIKFFVGSQDGRLFEHLWDVQADDWLWADHGSPDGTGVLTAAGALIIDPQNTSHPIKFFLGTDDGRLFEHRWDVQADDWVWGDHGAPDGTGVATAPGALIIDPQNTSHPIKFFVGAKDGRLFEHRWDVQANNWLWGDHGYPESSGIQYYVSSTPGALIVDPYNTSHPIKFFVIATAYKFLRHSTNRPAPEDHLFEHYWDNTSQQWLWTDHGTPTPTASNVNPPGTLTEPGALILDPYNTSHPIKFFVGTDDGRIFEHRWDVQANDWLWSDHGAPTGSGVFTAPGALIIDPHNTSHPIKFFVGAKDGRLFEHRWDVQANNWLWGDHHSYRISTFSGIATLTIEAKSLGSSLAAPRTFPISLNVFFTETHQAFVITGFPEIKTAPFEVGPILGKSVMNTTTVTMTDGGSGTFDPNTGEMYLPMTLHFAQSVFSGIDSDIIFTLSTEAVSSPGGVFNLNGSRVDAASGAVTLVGASRFMGGTLGGHDGALSISGKLNPVP